MGVEKSLEGGGDKKAMRLDTSNEPISSPTQIKPWLPT